MLAMFKTRRFVMVCDESHKIKNKQAKQSQSCVELGRLATRKYLLSGTFVANKPEDVWNQVNFLDGGHLLGSYNTFKKTILHRARFQVWVSLCQQNCQLQKSRRAQRQTGHGDVAPYEGAVPRFARTSGAKDTCQHDLSASSLLSQNLQRHCHGFKRARPESFAE